MPSNLAPGTLFAAVGDVHGRMHAMVRMLSGWEASTRQTLLFVLQVGDFEPIRHEDDLSSLAAPAKYRTIGEFPDFFNGRAVFPWPVYFIGGNHEPYGLLDTIPDGGQVIHNCTYIGRTGVIEIGGLRIAGLSGIFQADAFERRRPSLQDLGKTSKKEYTYFRKDDIDSAANFESIDILLVHEWPDGVIAPEHADEFENIRRSSRYDAVGNEYARLLMEVLEPRLVLCGHMHKRYHHRLRLESGKFVDVRCLAHMDAGRDAVAIYRVAEDGTLVEVWP
ncbi:MAG TPA: metallophosphoesterase [Polyangium sp.]|nr:metallophosphoesterase [Polyangium sp.]